MGEHDKNFAEKVLQQDVVIRGLKSVRMAAGMAARDGLNLEELMDVVDMHATGCVLTPHGSAPKARKNISKKERGR